MSATAKSIIATPSLFALSLLLTAVAAFSLLSSSPPANLQQSLPGHDDKNEKKVDVIEESSPDKDARLEELVLWFHRNGIYRILHASDETAIPTWEFKGDKPDGPVLLVLTGWSESAERYCEILFDFKPLFSHMIVIDHRSQGSAKKLEHLKSHIESCLIFFEEAAQVLDEVALPLLKGKQLVVYGFSMGGLVAVRLAMRRADVIDGLILLAPAFAPVTGYPPLVMRVILGLAKLLGYGQSFVPGHPAGSDHALLMPPHSRLSSSVSRLKFWEKLRLRNPSHIVNGMSVSHLNELVSKRFDTPNEFEKVKISALVISAGREQYVVNDAIFAFVEHAGPAQVRHVHFNDARHELLQERDAIRMEILLEVKKFVDVS